MDLPDWAPTWPSSALDLAQHNAQHIAVGAGAIGALIAIRTIRRFTKGREHDEVAANLGVFLFLVVTTEGMWEVVRHRLGVSPLLAVAMFAAYDTVIYGERAAALKALAKDQTARIGGHLAVIWCLSLAASITVSFASGNAATWFFRFFSPLVGAALATQKILAKRGDGAKRQESAWIWTPTRLMVRWGWVKPGAAEDLSAVFAARRIAALVDAALELDAAKTRSAEPSRWWRRTDPLTQAQQRVRRLTKAATEADMTAAREQIRRVLGAERELFRQDDRLDERDRTTLDDVRLIMRQATDRVRTGHARSPAPARDPLVELGGIRMPAHIAARIGSLPAHQATHVPPHSDSSADPARSVTVEPVRESITDSPAVAPATQRPTQQRITERLTTPAQRAEDKKLRQAYARLTKRLDREPSGAELAEATGVSKATANRWKRDNAPK